MALRAMLGQRQAFALTFGAPMLWGLMGACEFCDLMQLGFGRCGASYACAWY